jgi:hypothetical protein
VELDQYYDFRKRLVDALERDLRGPSDPREVLNDPPITRYLTGILFPRDAAEIDPAQDDDLGTESDEEGISDPPVAMAHVRYPSSMGMTFAVDTRTAKLITLRVEAARYDELEVDQAGEEAPTAQTDSGTSRRRRRASAPMRWQRRPLEIASCDIDATNPAASDRRSLADGLELFLRVRPANQDSIVAVTAVLVNKLQSHRGVLKDAFAFFQPRIHAVGPGATSPFVDRRGRRAASDDPDLRSYRLLYRHAAAIAVGHGCSVEWEVDPSMPMRARSVSTCFVPKREVLLADTNPEITVEALEMRFLAHGDRSKVLSGLDDLCRGYEDWLGKRAAEARSLVGDLRSIAEEHLAASQGALGRMKRGVDLLRSDEVPWKAFQLANQAMLQVRSRTVWKETGRPEAEPDDRGPHCWRPFQLAFVLLCLEGITEVGSADRAIADLLWFPTGGGKTEAYLALIAYTTFQRRLREQGGGAGVTAIMRYTLRLLTIQQFERAALLICSCEAIRRSRHGLGDQPISIGLWVGRAGAPNTLKAARIALDKLRRADRVTLDEGNPMQLQACPWCGTELQPKHYYIAQSDPKLVISCRNRDCLFKDELPVYVVDEDVYRFRPTLIVATSDKFASLPWREKVASLFDGGTDASGPPELIIQDELHLISGPLGTLAGLYETAVDLLCSRNGVGPKVIASTATIRRAGPQTAGLFNREVRQFPPPGLEARDSYFAVEASRESHGARQYVGLMAPGTSQTTLLVRAYAALLQYASVLDGTPAIRDPYWTLVGYFNSLRVLGGGRMQVQDDVSDRMTLLATDSGTAKRAIDERIELTSREPSGDIPIHLRRMAVCHPSPDALDVILATNMISVGVDIDRLGLMVVMGQPPSTSEYIQATSRVGRKYPGLVVTLYNASRSRDRSHYERFVDYHSGLYRQVESTSVTPFSARARDRGLHAVFVALARLTVPELAPRDAAGRVIEVLDKLRPVRQRILERVTRVAPEEYEATGRQLDEILEQWIQRAREVPGLVFDDWEHPERALLIDAGRGGEVEGPFSTLWSLRDVDRASGLYLVR